MKARTISKLRKKIQSKEYIENRMRKLAERCKKWNRFFQFECDEFYVGEELACLNSERHNKFGMRDKRKFEWYKKKYKL